MTAVPITSPGRPHHPVPTPGPRGLRRVPSPPPRPSRHRAVSGGPSVRSRYDGRALHLVDLENLTGDPGAGPERIARVWATYRGAVPLTPSDHVVVASCTLFARNAWWVLPLTGIQRRVRDGADGADLALREELDVAATARRFDRLVIASGDGGFTAAALEARAAGLHVHQVVGVSRSARRLSAAVSTRSRLRLPTAPDARRPLRAVPDPSALRRRASAGVR